MVAPEKGMTETLQTDELSDERTYNDQNNHRTLGNQYHIIMANLLNNQHFIIQSFVTK